MELDLKEAGHVDLRSQLVDVKDPIEIYPC